MGGRGGGGGGGAGGGWGGGGGAAPTTLRLARVVSNVNDRKRAGIARVAMGSLPSRARRVRTPAVRAREVSELGIGYAKSAGLTTLPLDRVASNASTGRPVMRCHRRNPKVLPAPAAPPQRISEAAIGFARAVRATTSRADPRASDALAPRESTTATQVNGNRYRVLKSTTEYCHEKSSNFHNHHHIG